MSLSEAINNFRLLEGIPAHSRDPRLIDWKPKRKATGQDAKDEAKLNKILEPLGFSVQWMEVDPDFDLFGVTNKAGHGVGQLEKFRQGWEVDGHRGAVAKIKAALTAAGEKVK